MQHLTTLVPRIVRFATRRLLAAIALVLLLALPAKAQQRNPAPDASLVDAAPFLLPYFNNGPVFGLPGTAGGDVWHRTQLSGDWGGVRTELARRGWFVDLYSTGAYQDVARGGLKTGSAFVQNTQLSINVDTGRAGLWPGGLLHVTVQSRSGSAAKNTFTVGSTVPQYLALALPGPLLDRDVLPTEYFLVQSLGTTFSVTLGKIIVITSVDQTLFANSYKDAFANFNFNKNPVALNFSNATALAALGTWRPAAWVTITGGVLDPNSQADNLATRAFDKANIYMASIFSYKLGGRPGQASSQYIWTNKPKIDLTAPFGPLSPAVIPQAVGVLVGSPSTDGLSVKFKSDTWAAVANVSQYLIVKGDAAATRGVGVFGRLAYAPAQTNPIARDASVALFANGLSDARPKDSFGVGIYYNGTSSRLKDDIAQLTGGKAAATNEEGLEIFYDLAVTPAISVIPSYQHIWNPLTADVTSHQHRADVFLARLSLRW